MPVGLARAMLRSDLARRVMANPWAPLAEVRALDPCTASAKEMRQLAQTCVDRGLSVLHVWLRSNELWPGQSEACPRAEDVDRVYANVEGFLRYAVDELRATPRTLGEFAGHYLDDTACV